MAIETKRFMNKQTNCSCCMTGVWRAVAYMRGVVVVFHSPRACAHVARSMDINSHLRSLADAVQENQHPVPIVASQLEQKHAIFGGVERLKQCLRAVAEQYHPQAIVVANSCLCGVMGDDVPALAREAETELGVPVLAINTYGFLDGEYYQGYFDMTAELVRRYLHPQQREAGTAVLLGDSGGPWNYYATEVRRLLDAMGVRVLGQFPSYLALDELPVVTRAEASVVLSNAGPLQQGLLDLAATLRDQFGVACMPDAHYPLDWDGTQAFITDMGRLFGREAQAAAVLAAERQTMDDAVAEFLPATAGKRAVLCIGRWLMFFQPSIIVGTLRRLQYELAGAVLLPGYPEAEHTAMVTELRRLLPEGAPILDSTDTDADALLQSADQVFTTHELRQENLRQVWLPLNPIIGTTGEIRFMRGLYRALSSRRVGGSMTYVY